MKKKALSLEPIDYAGHTCASCGHTRRNSDPLPAWACPACGVSYATTKSAEDSSGQFYAVKVQRAPEVSSSDNKKPRSQAHALKRARTRKASRKTLSQLLAGAVLTISALGALVVYEYNQSPQGGYQQQERQHWTETRKLHLVDEEDSIARR